MSDGMLDPRAELRQLGAKIQRGASYLASKPAFWALFVVIMFTWPIVRSIRAEAEMPGPLPVLGQVEPFALHNERGEPFGSDKLDGKVWVANFIFTRCVMSCPNLTAKMQQVQHRTRNLGRSFHLVSFSVDPEHDRPEVLQTYAKRNRASRAMWSFLTSDTRAEMERIVIGNFKIAIAGAATDADSMTLTHGNSFALVDRERRVRGYYDVDDDGAIDRLLRDAGLLINRGY